MAIVNRCTSDLWTTANVSIIVDDGKSNKWLPIIERRHGPTIAILELGSALLSEFEHRGKLSPLGRILAHPDLPATVAEAVYASGGHDEDRPRIYIRTSNGGHVATIVANLEEEWLNTRNCFAGGDTDPVYACFDTKIFNLVDLSADDVGDQLREAYEWATVSSAPIDPHENRTTFGIASIHDMGIEGRTVRARLREVTELIGKYTTIDWRASGDPDDLRVPVFRFETIPNDIRIEARHRSVTAVAD